MEWLLRTKPGGLKRAVVDSMWQIIGCSGGNAVARTEPLAAILALIGQGRTRTLCVTQARG